MADLKVSTIPARLRTKSITRTKYTHTVSRSFNVETCIELNLNKDFLCLDGYLDYTIAEYLEDRASDGTTLISKKRNVYSFSDGVVEKLSQRPEAIDMTALNAETLHVLWGAGNGV